MAPGRLRCMSSYIQHWLFFQASRNTRCKWQQDASLLGATSSRVFVQEPVIWSPPTFSLISIPVRFILMPCTTSSKASSSPFQAPSVRNMDLAKRQVGCLIYWEGLTTLTVSERGRDGCLVYFISPLSSLQYWYVANCFPSFRHGLGSKEVVFPFPQKHIFILRFKGCILN